MSNYLATDTDLIAVANAIRVKGGTSSSLSFPNGYVSAIQDIQTGGNLEDITINQNYLVKQNTVINNGIIFQTDETYPGTPVVLNNTTATGIDNGSLGQRGAGIKIDLSKTYHCIGELKIEWSTGEQEIYSIDSDFILSNYGTESSLSFSWEGVGTSIQTFYRINFCLSGSNPLGYNYYINAYTASSLTKSGVLLDGSYYQISVTSDGFNTINLNLSDDPRFQTIYKSLAYRSVIASSAPGVSEWCNSLSNIYSFQFAGQKLSGSFTFNNVTSVQQGAFGSCRNLSEANFPNCTTISNSAFYSCPSLSNISFPNCTTIGSSAFQSCSALSNINFPQCTSIDAYAFQNCTRLTSAYFPECTSIRGNAFYNCYSLTTISFPKCTYINYQAFYYCSSLTSAYFPECSILSDNAFRNCPNLAIVSFPKCATIANYVFNNCPKLESAYFMASSIISLGGTNVFAFTPMSFSSYLGYFGSIYVPSSLLASYKTATNWSAYSARMVGI